MGLGLTKKQYLGSPATLMKEFGGAGTKTLQNPPRVGTLPSLQCFILSSEDGVVGVRVDWEGISSCRNCMYLQGI